MSSIRSYKKVRQRILDKEYRKVSILILLLLICEAANYYFHFVLRSELVFSHIFYIPIVLAGFWWGKRGIWVAVLLGVSFITFNILSSLNTALSHSISRSVTFVAVGLAVGFLKDLSLRSDKILRVMCAYFENLMNFANSPIIVWDPTSRITQFNRAFENLTGYTADEVVGQKLSMLFPEAHRDESLENIERAMSGEFLESVRITIQCKNGETRSALWNSANIYAEVGGTLLSTIAQGQDITERIHAYEALQTSEEQYRTMIEQSNDMIWILDKEGAFTFFNKRAEEISGYEFEEWREKSFEPLIVKEDLPRVLEAFNKTLDGEPQHYEVRVKKDRADTIILSVNTAPILKAGEVVGTVSFGRDITERKKAEKALRESEEKYRVLFEMAKDSIFLSDESGRFIDVNKAACTSLGYGKEELLQMSNHEIDADSAGIDAFRKVRNGKLKEALFEVNQRRKDGTLLPVEITGSVYTSSGKQYFLASARDISERRRLEEQLRQSQKVEAIGTLAGGVAHDFNNLLTPILGFTEIALSDIPEDSRTHENLSHVLKAAERAKQLTRQILTFSRKSERKLKPINLTSTVKEALNLLQRTLPATIEIRQYIEPNINTVNADPTQMHQILLNLCSNAEHAMPEGGILEISLANIEIDEELCNEINNLVPGSYVNLTVMDSGCGMSKNILERIFDPFFTTKDQELGTGMGLSVVHGIVKSHGGEIVVQSEVGSGTSFQIYLPAAKCAAASPAVTIEPVRRGTESILFVDNETAIAEMGKRTLERLGYHVVTQTNSVKALELFRLDPCRFDIVITDQTMPHMTGVDLAAALLKIRPDIPIILCTGYSPAITPEKVRTLGIRKSVMKPLVGAELSRTVRHILDESSEKTDN